MIRPLLIIISFIQHISPHIFVCICTGRWGQRHRELHQCLGLGVEGEGITCTREGTEFYLPWLCTHAAAATAMAAAVAAWPFAAASGGQVCYTPAAAAWWCSLPGGCPLFPIHSLSLPRQPAGHKDSLNGMGDTSLSPLPHKYSFGEGCFYLALTTGQCWAIPAALKIWGGMVPPLCTWERKSVSRLLFYFILLTDLVSKCTTVMTFTRSLPLRESSSWKKNWQSSWQSWREK